MAAGIQGQGGIHSVQEESEGISGPTRSDFDGIILGTGHNALVLQAYLCRCGLKVLAVDRAPRVGGGCLTIQNPRVPGVWHNTHSFYHRALTAMPWYKDLELEEKGARYLEPELNVEMLLRDGRSLQWWTDLDRTADSFAQFSTKDAAALCRWAEGFRPILDNFLIPEAQSPPLPPDIRRRWLEASKLGKRLLEIQELSPLEFVCREFEHDVVRAGLLFFNGLREVDLRLPGFGHAIPGLLASKHKAQMCLGGSHKLAQALAQDITAHGGAFLLGVELKRLLLESGRAAGVELLDGERLEALEFVASGLNPQQTFLDFLPYEQTGHLKEQAARFEYNLIAPLFATHLVLKEPPRYLRKHPPEPPPFMVILGLDRFEQFHAMISAHQQGTWPPQVTWGSCPTLFDPTQAPPGLHTAFMWQKAPYALRNNPMSWLTAKEEFGRRMLEHWSSFAPNLSAAILDAFHLSPLDTELALPNMRRGDLLIGSFGNGQVGYHRPFRGAGEYRTPIPRLYLCGGCAHPGGNITGLPGYNAARVIAADLGLDLWWHPPPPLV